MRSINRVDDARAVAAAARSSCCFSPTSDNSNILSYDTWTYAYVYLYVYFRCMLYLIHVYVYLYVYFRCIYVYVYLYVYLRCILYLNNVCIILIYTPVKILVCSCVYSEVPLLLLAHF
jgi:hypothetical protein